MKGGERQLDIVGTVADLHHSTGQFSVLLAGLRASGLERALRSNGTVAAASQLTLFAPTDSAFEALPGDCLLAECIAAIRTPADPVVCCGCGLVSA